MECKKRESILSKTQTDQPTLGHTVWLSSSGLCSHVSYDNDSHSTLATKLSVSVMWWFTKWHISGQSSHRCRISWLPASIHAFFPIEPSSTIPNQWPSLIWIHGGLEVARIGFSVADIRSSVCLLTHLLASLKIACITRVFSFSWRALLRSQNSLCSFARSLTLKLIKNAIFGVSFSYTSKP